MRLGLYLLTTTACASALISATPVRAQDAAQLGEIIVTARKRQESILNVPVVETAISQAQLERLQTVDLKGVESQVPGLLIGESVASIGSQVSLRGVGTNSLDAGIDQSVALNIDGLQLTQGLAYTSGMFDVAQVEVLKGPQSLFYGKNSPGGVISLRTADPTDRFEIIARAAHEFVAQENRGEFIISGPVSDTLRLRLATAYDASQGYFINNAVPAPGTGALAPAHQRAPREKSAIVRGTAIWRPVDNFDARLKLNYVHDDAQEAGETQMVSCPDGTGAPLGIPFLASDCKLDRKYDVVSMDPNAFLGLRNGGTPFITNNQAFGTLELNYRPRADLTLTSTTALYHLDSDSQINATESGFAGPVIATFNHLTRRDVTQELRANSDFSGPLNFTAGAFFQDGRVLEHIYLPTNRAYRLPLPPVLVDQRQVLNINSYSVFGQARYEVIPRLELALGARWTNETRTVDATNLVSGAPIAVANPKIESDNLSPELTVTYRPTDSLTLYGSLKKGFKSGSFTLSTPVFNGSDNSFGDEKVQGGEIGVKTRLFDRSLLLNFAAYDYRYLGLQTSANQAVSGGIPTVHTVNAGSALIYGVDFDVTYRPQWIDGLTLTGAVNWNHARFKTLDNVPCWGGQTIAEGCNQLLNPNTGLFTSQSLAGSPLVRAPDWEASFGFDYEIPIGHEMRLALSNYNQYTSKYLTNLGNRPDFYQQHFLKTDVTLAVRGPDDRWEFALIGRNLGDKLTANACTNFSAATGAVLLAPRSGGTTRNAAGVDELGCNIDAGSQVWLRLTVRPFS